MLLFSEYLEIDYKILDEYSALNIYLDTDIPLYLGSFLLLASEKNLNTLNNTTRIKELV